MKFCDGFAKTGRSCLPEIRLQAHFAISDCKIRISRRIPVGNVRVVAVIIAGIASGFLGLRQQNVEAEDVHWEDGIHDLEASGTEETAEAFVCLD